jgi:hypothetical protein
MTEALVSDLLAIIRQTPGDPGPFFAARLERESAARSREGQVTPESIVAELIELTRRARILGATDEELALSLGALLAASRALAVAP